MKSENLITFGLGEFLDDIRDVMAKKRYRHFLIHGGEVLRERGIHVESLAIIDSLDNCQIKIR